MNIYKVLQYSKVGGIIEGQPGEYEHVWHYDVNSLYPYILTTTPLLPNFYAASVTTTPSAYDPTYAYWSTTDGMPLDHEIEVIPSGWIRMPLSIPNPYRSYIESLYKERCKWAKGTPENKLCKLKLNSFIGKLGQHMRRYMISKGAGLAATAEVMGDYLTAKPNGINYPKADGQHLTNFAAYQYLIAQARLYMRRLLPNDTIPQINTDGFFTMAPLDSSKVCTNNQLGGLRMEYEGINLKVFAANQYVCTKMDGGIDVCISGLPKGKYIAGTNNYETKVITYKQGVFIYDIRTFNLRRD